eukprot:587-Prorocentrum_minimum.AAC.3
MDVLMACLPTSTDVGRPTRWRVQSTPTTAADLTAKDSCRLKDEIIRLASATDRGASTPSKIAAGNCFAVWAENRQRRRTI